jgi:hypothetical protein
MESYPFIFSNAWPYRIGRHLTFWIFWWLFQGFLYAFTPITPDMDYLQKLLFSMVDSLLFLFDHMFLSYSLMYFVVPVFLLKNRYLATSIWVILLFLAAGALSTLLARYTIAPARHLVASFCGIPDASMEPYRRSFFYGLLAGLRGAITIAGLAVAIKLMKYWYIKEQRNMQLQKENMESQLQLLKAQIHPHFLFNTLNNIYSYTQNTSATASQLVLGLSDMLRYMLYEGDQPLVPLSKELKMIGDYISIEKIRYGNKLELQIDLPEEPPENGYELYIAPLLLLPFIENCFKHGTSNFLENPWLSLQIGIEDEVMTMKLLNGKSPAPPNKGLRRGGIGISNVRRRLELVYPWKHKLIVTDDPDVFIINLKLQLEKRRVAPRQTAPVTLIKTHD